VAFAIQTETVEAKLSGGLAHKELNILEKKPEKPGQPPRPVLVLLVSSV